VPATGQPPTTLTRRTPRLRWARRPPRTRPRLEVRGPDKTGEICAQRPTCAAVTDPTLQPFVAPPVRGLGLKPLRETDGRRITLFAFVLLDDDGVPPQRGLPSTGIAQKIGLQAGAHAGGGVHGVLAVAVPHTAAERHLRQVALAQPLAPNSSASVGHAKSSAATVNSSGLTPGANQPDTG
jgi:hypothetical protein